MTTLEQARKPAHADDKHREYDIKKCSAAFFALFLIFRLQVDQQKKLNENFFRGDVRLPSFWYMRLEFQFCKECQK